MKPQTSPKAQDWLNQFRAEVARLRGADPQEIYKADSVTLALLEHEQRQLSLCWNLPRKPP